MANIPVILFEGKEYFSIRRFSFDYLVQYGMVLKTCSIDINRSDKIIDFRNLLGQKKSLLGTVYIQNKVFLEGYLTSKMLLPGRNSDTGSFRTFNLYDRFYPLIESESVKINQYKKLKTLEQTLEILLDELNFVKYTNPQTKITETYSYQKSISSVKDFISYGYNVKRPIVLERYGEQYNEFSQETANIIGRLCNIHQKVIISNGYDTLKIENINDVSSKLVYVLSDSEKDGNIINWSQGADDKKLQAKHIEVYNTFSKTSKQQDKNTSLVINYENGMPNVKNVRTINRNMSYSNIAKHMDYELCQINANSHTYSITITAPSFLDINKNFLEPNKKILFISKSNGIEEEMTIVSVSGEVTSEGIKIVLGCSPVDVFNKQVNQKFKKAIIKR
jgi:hypothetical protein